MLSLGACEQTMPQGKGRIMEKRRTDQNLPFNVKGRLALLFPSLIITLLFTCLAGRAGAAAGTCLCSCPQQRCG